MYKKIFTNKNDQFSIRTLVPDDVDLLVEFLSLLSPESKRWYSPHKFDRETVENVCLKNNNNNMNVVVTHNDKIVGYCTVFLGVREWDNKRYDGTLDNNIGTIAPCIRDDFQHRGIGSEMLRYIIDICTDIGKKKIILWSGVVVDNKKAVEFYEKLGFDTYRRWHHEIQHVDCLDMYINLEPDESKDKHCNTNIMVLGAAGSLGSNLCQELLFKGYKITAVDFNENELMYLKRTFGISCHLLNICNTKELIRLIDINNIDAVINCAAYKHVTWCESNVIDAVETNMMVNLRIMSHLKEIEEEIGKKKKFVFISTDKAISPKNIYALTKQFSDYTINLYGHKLVRGVNFLNSKGSVLNIWDSQRIKNKPFTLVKQNCLRYFITISEMTNLVAEALEDNTNKVEFAPSVIYLLPIKKLFEAYILYHGINDYKLTEFDLPLNEKEVEDLDFNPIITELSETQEIVSLLNRTYAG